MNLLIIDDEAPAREELAWLLEQCDGTRHQDPVALLHAVGKQFVVTA